MNPYLSNCNGTSYFLKTAWFYLKIKYVQLKTSKQANSIQTTPPLEEG